MSFDCTEITFFYICNFYYIPQSLQYIICRLHRLIQAFIRGSGLGRGVKGIQFKRENRVKNRKKKKFMKKYLLYTTFSRYKLQYDFLTIKTN